METKVFIRTVYLYLFSLVGLFFLVFGTMGFVKLALTTWVFPEADYSYYSAPKPLLPDNDLREDLENCKENCNLTEEEKVSLNAWLNDYKTWQDKQEDPSVRISRRRQNQAAENLASIIVGLPLYLYHWSVIKKEAKRRKKRKA